METIQRYMVRLFILLTIIFCLTWNIKAQKATSKSDDPNSFPELIFTNINGAPKLQKPILIMGGSKPAAGEGNGWAAPAMWDYNKDGKKDLLIGEFGSGSEVNRKTGHLIRVYFNIGSDESPKFNEDFKFLLGEYNENSNGAPLSIRQFCCMSFKPQFCDLNNDGVEDLYTGNFFGEVTWFEGSKRGFSSGKLLEQQGYLTDEQRLNQDSSKVYFRAPENDPRNSGYWAYSAVSFGEFNGDDLPDMVVGGTQGLRISRNIGNKSYPKVGLRESLHDPEGKPLWDEKWGRAGYIPYVIDWDQDGVLDLLVSSNYSNRGNIAIMFFKGRRKGTALFEKGIPLFTTEGGNKAFPGDYLNVSVTDWNNDGINDLLIGTKIVTLNGFFNSKLSWTWSHEAGMSKVFNPGYYSAAKSIEIKQEIKNAEKLELEIGKEEMKKRRTASTNIPKEEIIKKYYGKMEYETLIEKGYVYLMLGEKK